MTYIAWRYFAHRVRFAGMNLRDRVALAHIVTTIPNGAPLRNRLSARVARLTFLCSRLRWRTGATGLCARSLAPATSPRSRSSAYSSVLAAPFRRARLSIASRSFAAFNSDCQRLVAIGSLQPKMRANQFCVIVTYSVVVCLKPNLHSSNVNSVFVGINRGYGIGQRVGCPWTVGDFMLVHGPTGTLRCQLTEQHLEVVCALLRFKKEFPVVYQSFIRLICAPFRYFAEFFVSSVPM